MCVVIEKFLLVIGSFVKNLYSLNQIMTEKSLSITVFYSNLLGFIYFFIFNIVASGIFNQVA